MRVSVVEVAAGRGNIGGPRAAGMHGIQIEWAKEKKQADGKPVVCESRGSACLSRYGWQGSQLGSGARIERNQEPGTSWSCYQLLGASRPLAMAARAQCM